MEQIFTLLLLFIVVGLLNRFVGAAKGKQRRTQVPDDAEDREAIAGASADLGDLIMQELGLERRPRVQELPQPAEPSDTVVYPKQREPVAETARARTEDAAEVVRRREREVAQRRAEPPTRRPSRRPERGAAVSLERPRRPEDHERFHERYAVPTPVQTHTEFHERYMQAATPGRRRTRSQVRLPEQRHWSAAQKAIVWAELLGPPKGITV